MFWSIALYLGDGGYQIVKMGIISYTHWLMQRRGAAIGEPSLEGKDDKEVIEPAHFHLVGVRKQRFQGCRRASSGTHTHAAAGDSNIGEPSLKGEDDKQVAPLLPGLGLGLWARQLR